MPKARKITPRTPTTSSAPPVLAIAADRRPGDIRALIEAPASRPPRAVNPAPSALTGTSASGSARTSWTSSGPGTASRLSRRVETIDRGVWAGVLEAESVADDAAGGSIPGPGAVFHAVRSNVSPQSKMRSTGMREPGTAGFALATWPGGSPQAARGIGPIHVHTRGDRVDVPDHQRARLKVVGTFGGHLLLGGLTVVGLVSDLDRKGRRPRNQAHLVRREWAGIKRCIGGERLAPELNSGIVKPMLSV